jgi:hypothetical protein
MAAHGQAAWQIVPACGQTNQTAVCGIYPFKPSRDIYRCALNTNTYLPTAPSQFSSRPEAVLFPQGKLHLREHITGQFHINVSPSRTKPFPLPRLSAGTVSSTKYAQVC